MTPFAFMLVLISESCSAAGQIFFKHAMSGREGNTGRKLTAGGVVNSACSGRPAPD